MSKTEEDFWNTSCSSGFNFDDEGDGTRDFDDIVFNSVLEESSVLPIHTIISKHCLDLILDDIKSTNETVVPPVKETIKKMSYGENYTLQIYRKFNEKLSLLDCALETCDGNVIINVILFLKGSLRQNIFFHQLAKRKLAVKSFAYYLMINGQFQELADMYMATGNTFHMKELYYLIGNGIKNKDILYKKLEHFMVDHLQKLNSNNDKLELYENMHLIQWQIDQKMSAHSLIEQLTQLSKTEFSQNRNYNDKTMEFKKNFKIDDFAFEWTIMNVMASMEAWSILKDLFIKPNWLSKKNVLKTVVSPEIFVNGLSRHKPPKEILEQYLPCISDSEKSLHLALKLQCHNFVIQQYINQRDRLGLISYKKKVPAQSPEYFLIEGVLHSVDKKWKN